MGRNESLVKCALTLIFPNHSLVKARRNVWFTLITENKFVLTDVRIQSPITNSSGCLDSSVNHIIRL